MNKHKYIQTLGIKKSYICRKCRKRMHVNDTDRHVLAECIMENSAGMWALIHCVHCGWVYKLYPIRINGVPCTPRECDQLHEEMKQYEKEKEESQDDT